MKRFLFAITAAAVALSPTAAMAKTGLEGRWKNGAMEIVIAPCGAALCGRVVKASAKQKAKSRKGSGTNLIGARVIDNIKPAGPGLWNANVFVATRDVNAKGTIKQDSENRLTVRGCVLGVICKTSHWDRVG